MTESPNPTDTLVGLAVKPLAGSDLLLRHGDIVMVISTQAEESKVDLLLDLASAAANEGGDGRRLVRRLALFLTDDDGDRTPSFVALVPTKAGMALLIHGDAQVVVTDSAGEGQELSGRSSAAWVDRIIDWPLTQLVATTSASTDDQPDPRSQLLDGVVPAGGFAVMPMSSARPVEAADPTVMSHDSPVEPVVAEPVIAEPVVAEPVLAPTFESVLLIGQAAVENPEPLPLASDEPRDRDDEPAVIVKGIMCKRHHFNSPKAAFCGVCGISMVQQTHQLLDGPRPPLGVIVLDDGTTFRLDADYVIGREPENDADVIAGNARAMPIDDPEGSISRIHALIKLDGWEVQLVDRGSANGTHVAPPGEVTWSTLTPREPLAIIAGTRVQLGSRSFVFDAHFGV